MNSKNEINKHKVSSLFFVGITLLFLDQLIWSISQLIYFNYDIILNVNEFLYLFIDWFDVIGKFCFIFAFVLHYKQNFQIKHFFAMIFSIYCLIISIIIRISKQTDINLDDNEEIIFLLIDLIFEFIMIISTVKITINSQIKKKTVGNFICLLGLVFYSYFYFIQIMINIGILYYQLVSYVILAILNKTFDFLLINHLTLIASQIMGIFLPIGLLWIIDLNPKNSEHPQDSEVS